MCNLLHLLKRIYSEVMIPHAVYHEAVVRGLEEGFQDAQAIKNTLEAGWLKISKPPRCFKEKVKEAEKRLGVELEGERETIALALERGITSLLTNDEEAYHVGRILGLKPRGILYMLLKSVREGDLSKEKAKEVLSQILKEGFWLSPAIIHKFHEELDKFNPHSNT